MTEDKFIKRDVVAFIHTYAQDRELGSYLDSLVKAFINTGVRLHFILTNDLVDNLGNTSLKLSISSRKIVEYINSVNAAFVFTTNHGGITKKIQKEIHCPIITWMVDRIPFLHHGGTHEDLFCEKDHVITSSFSNVKRLETIYPMLKDRVTYLPFATNAIDFSEQPSIQDINISFVGTYFYCGLLTQIFEAYASIPELCKNILNLAEAVENDYDLDFEYYVKFYKVERVLKDFNLDLYRFKGLLANSISLNKRIKALDAVNDLGLKLYGTENWIQANAYSLDLLRKYQFGQFIKTRSQLVDVYQRSKIALNISHHQAVNGLPYRIFDIMASKAMLLTEYREHSDLFRLFGRDLPMPMYRDTNELRKLTRYYLEHEDERKEIVYKCNQLIKNGFSFEERVGKFFEILSIPHEFHTRGELIKLYPGQFSKSYRNVSSSQKPSIAIMLLLSISPLNKLRLKRYLNFVLPAFLNKRLKNYYTKLQQDNAHAINYSSKLHPINFFKRLKHRIIEKQRLLGIKIKSTSQSIKKIITPR